MTPDEARLRLEIFGNYLAFDRGFSIHTQVSYIADVRRFFSFLDSMGESWDLCSLSDDMPSLYIHALADSELCVREALQGMFQP
jgi:site-specific recombinase XerD